MLQLMLWLAAMLERFQTRRVASWFVLGIGATLAEGALLRLLVEVLEIALPVATAMAAEAAILVKFTIADHWVFGHRRPTVGRLIRYHGASAGALGVYWVVINGLALFLEVPYLIGFVLGTGAAFAWSLVTNFLWVWAHPAVSR
jgi:putative flippase GtrA